MCRTTSQLYFHWMHSKANAKQLWNGHPLLPNISVNDVLHFNSIKCPKLVCEVYKTFVLIVINLQLTCHVPYFWQISELLISCELVSLHHSVLSSLELACKIMCIANIIIYHQPVGRVLLQLTKSSSPLHLYMNYKITKTWQLRVWKKPEHFSIMNGNTNCETGWKNSMWRRVAGKSSITERNRRSSWEWQGIIAFCTCQWDEWIQIVLPTANIFY
jgi:hypothetical protein